MSAGNWIYDDYTGEHFCYDCNRAFNSWSALRRHMVTSSRHAWCERCDLEFDSVHARLSHYVNSPRHGYCTLCSWDYDTKEELLDHFEEEHAICSECKKVFRDGTGLHEHARQSHPYCIPCRRIFKSPANLNAHLGSALHNPATLPCPGRGCPRKFIDLSAITLHLESGTCISGFTRHELDKMVRRADQKTNLVTVPQRMIGWSDSAPPPPTYMATAAAWNYAQGAYECYLCHRHFAQLASLNLHLASPRHSGAQEKYYRCPSPACRVEFGTVSGLVQHIEKGGCGVRKFKMVQDKMEALIRGTRAIAL